MPLSRKIRRTTISVDPPDPPPTPYGTGEGRGVIVVAGNTVKPAVSSRADFVVSSTETSGVAAKNTIQNAIDTAGDGGTVLLLGTFYVSDTIRVDYSRFTLMGAGAGTMISPTSQFPNGKAIIAVGDSTTFRPFNRVCDLAINGRHVSGNGLKHPDYQIVKNIRGLQFASYMGNIQRIQSQNCTGYALDLSAPAVNGVAVNTNYGTHLAGLWLGRSLTGVIRFGGNGAGAGVTWIGGVAMHAGRMGDVFTLDDGHDIVVEADDVTLISIQPYSPTGACVLINADVKRFRTMNLKPEGSNDAWGPIYANAGGDGWLLQSIATRTGGGTCLHLPNVTNTVVHGCELSGELKDGGQATAPNKHGIELTGAQQVSVGASQVKRDRYYAGNWVIHPGDGNIIEQINRFYLKRKGTYTITTAAGSVEIAHRVELPPTLSNILLQPQGSLGTNGRVWITTPTTNGIATHFKLNWAGLPAAPTVPVSWFAEWHDS